MNVDAFVEGTLKLLAKERDASIEETEGKSLTQLKRQGGCLTALYVLETRTGLAGRMVWELGKLHGDDKELPSHNFRNGDAVAVLPSKAAKQGLAQMSEKSEHISGRGVVTSSTRERITVVFEDHEPDDIANLSLALLRTSNDVPYRRVCDSLQLLRKYSWGPAVQVREALLEEREPDFDTNVKIQRYYNPSLNDSQKAAVQRAIAARDFALIHGPPGTGKTSTTVEIIRQAIERGQKVLACAPSNVAVDNLVERLGRSKSSVVRVGHPARLLPGILQYSLDALVQQSDNAELVSDIRNEVKAIHQNLAKTKSGKERYKLYGELRALNREIRQRETKALHQVIDEASVVLATLTGAADRDLKTHDFDLVVIDECTQSTEAGCWAALLKGRRCVLVGDPKQLPPTIRDAGAAKQGLERTLFLRLQERYGDKVTTLLNIQYRMNEAIMQWSSREFYDNALVADDLVRNHLLRDLPDVAADDENLQHALVMIDTAGCDMEERKEADGDSLLNPGEADVVVQYVTSLLVAGVREDQIAVISPYAAQVRELQRRLGEEWAGIETGTVDGFQGREKEVVILSCVRSNDSRDVGFLSDERRMNVAVTRARRQLCLIGDSETIGSVKFLERLVDHFSEFGDYRSADHAV